MKGINKVKKFISVKKSAETLNLRYEHILSREKDFGIKEAYKAIRTNLMFALAENQSCRKVIVTSAVQGEGKTSTTVNLAIAFAMMGNRVLLIDCDLRRPRVHRMLNIKKECGISEVVAGMSDVESAIKKADVAPDIDCMTSGRVPPNPAELLASGKMRELIAKLEEKYDYIFLDTPPVTIVADALSMRDFADGYVLVVRENYTPKELLKEARERLDFAGSKILGYVMTGVKGGGVYGNSYKYKYKYGYRYVN